MNPNRIEEDANKYREDPSWKELDKRRKTATFSVLDANPAPRETTAGEELGTSLTMGELSERLSHDPFWGWGIL